MVFILEYQIIEKFHESVDYLINSILNRRHKCKLRKYICMNLFYEYIFLSVLFFAVYSHRYMSIM